MLKKHILLIFLNILFLNSLKAQSLDSLQLNQIEFMKQVAYRQGVDLYKKNKQHYRTRDFDAPWLSLMIKDTESYQAALDTIVNNAQSEVKLNGFTGAHFALKSHFPVNTENNHKVFNLKIVKSNLKDSLNNTIKLNKVCSIGYGAISSGSYSTERSISWKWQTINAAFSFEDDIKTNNISGSVVLRAEFVTKYDYVKITPKSKGTEFVLNGQKFKVVDIMENRVVLHPLFGSYDDADFSFVNINENNEEVKSLTLLEINKLMEEDSTISYSSIGSGMSMMYKAIYDAFKSNPAQDYETFSKALHGVYIKLVTSKDRGTAEVQFLGPKYIVIRTAGPIENLYLYFPIYGAKKDFEVKVN
ncbi:MAG: hypothetical protein ACK4ND_12565 [Cytophagaceae bacterium]